MNKILTISIICLMALSLLTPYAVAGGEKYFHGTKLPASFGEEIGKLLSKIWMVYASRDLYNFLMEIFDHLPEYLTANPDINDIRSAQGLFIRLVQPVFVFSILLVAGYGLLYSDSPRTRAKSKGLTIRLIYAMVLISLTPYISYLLLYLSEYFTRAILGMAETGTVTSAIKKGTGYMFHGYAILTLIHRTGGVEVLLLWETFLLIFNFTMAVRYLLVIVWHIVLPISILFFAFKPLKKIGKKFLHQTMLWTFVQVGWAIGALGITVVLPALDRVAPDYPMEKIGVGCLLLLLTAPRMILGLMDWLSLGIEVIEIVNAAPLSVGALTMDEMKVERGVVMEEPSLDGI